MTFNVSIAQQKFTKTTPEWAKNANIYEVNIRQYTPEGTFNAFLPHLDRLKAQNTSIIWIMPIYPISQEGRKGSLGSYYAIKNYKEINPEFGSLDDFKALVTKAHSLGIKVIIDWVANHTGRDNVWTKSNPEWFNHDADGKISIPKDTDWDDVADLNYNNSQMRLAMIDAMKYWIDVADIDGFRCDVAGMVPTDFWVQARKELEKKKTIFMLAEDENPKIHAAFDMTYGWQLHHILNDVAQSKKDCRDIIKFYKKDYKKFKPQDYRMNFTSNHDENTWSKSEYDRMGNAAVTMAALTYYLPGMPLVYSGQEAANKKALKFFDKDTIDFSNCCLQSFYTKLNQTKLNNQDLWNGQFGAKVIFEKHDNLNNVLVFTRGKTKCIFNLSSSQQIYHDTQKLTSKILKPWEYLVISE